MLCPMVYRNNGLLHEKSLCKIGRVFSDVDSILTLINAGRVRRPAFRVLTTSMNSLLCVALGVRYEWRVKDSQLLI